MDSSDKRARNGTANQGSSQSSHGVRPVAVAEREQAVAILVTAFDRDPIARRLFADGAERHKRHEARFTRELQSEHPGKIIEVTDDLSAIAIWHAPDYEEPVSAQPADTTSLPARLFAAVHDLAPPPPYWYLAFLAARSPGNGGGSALLRHRLGMIDGAAALWTGNEANVGFYQRFGFNSLGQKDAHGARFWWMVRPPRA